MATKKVRVYELARELGVENAVVIELATELKVGVKSHSSSVDEPSADRIRRLADSMGLKKEPEPEPEAPKPAPAQRKVVRAGSSSVVRSHAEPAAPAPAPPAAPAKPEPKPEPRPEPKPEPRPEPKAKSVPPPPPKSGGKPIPPPPGRRVPPPPPGPRRTPSAGPRSGAAPSRGRGGAPAGAGAGAGAGRPGGFTPGGPDLGRGAGRGGPGGGGPAGRGRPQQRRKKKRRRQVEELEPERISYTASDTPVPEGEIVVPRGITIQEYAPKLNRTSADLVRLMFDAGEMVTATQSLADEMVELIAEELGATVLLVDPGHEEEVELLALLDGSDEEEDESLLRPRSPIVTVMGHVDHGKTTLLDYLRKENVAAGEAGGITQHIGAYQVLHDGKPITLIDTPGHEAFTAMRARGAQATDIAILVVAADDGVMPQTIEAISHARAAEVPIIVAVTKVDKEGADPARVRQQLVEAELIPEEWGGDTIVTDVSAPTGQGVDDLLANIVLVSEVEDLRANPEGPARAYVLESNVDPGRGPVATVLIEAGTLRLGDIVVAGAFSGKVRALINDHGENIKEAMPSMPVQVLGLDGAPLAGDELRVAPSEKLARTVAEARGRRRRASDLTHPTSLAGGIKLEDIFALVSRGEVATLNLVLKADVQGSLEALTDSLRKLDQDHTEVRLSFVHRAVGGITESDVNLATVSNATIIGFNVRPDKRSRELAKKEGIELRLYEVIYKALEDVESALVGMLSPEYEEIVTGEAEVREVFSVPRAGKVAGCFVRSGTITRGSGVRFLRDGTIIWKGTIATLRRFKEDVREVKEGFECGIGLENFQDLKPGDVIETFENKEVARTLR